MGKNLLLYCLLFFCYLAASGQSVKGSLSDSSGGKDLSNASVMLLRSKDSVLVRYTRAAAGGIFSLQADPGPYTLLISFPGFADYSDSIRLGQQTLDLGKIYLTPRSKLLEEILIRKTIPAIRIKGDTVVYKADSFHVQPGATVEDLLKKLPGITVDRNGTITAQGERVRKILVDGEEFFSDDPTIATRNLQSAMVDELEVFDKKSDQAEFSGVDDGQRTKTLNLKLKEDKKNGYFGKLEAGSNFNNFWSNTGMLNYFKGKRKLSGHAMMASDGRTGLNFEEMMNYGGMGNMETEMSEGGGMMISIEGPEDDFDWGRFEGEGLPRSWSAGLNYSDKWDQDKKNINATYRFKKLNNDATVTNRGQNILPDNSFFNNDVSRRFSTRQSHSGQGVYTVKLDSSSSLKVVASGVKGSGMNYQQTFSESLRPNGDPINTGQRFNNLENDTEGFNSNLTYRKKFKKTGHTFSASFRHDYSLKASEGFLRALNHFFDSKGVLIQKDSIDQQKSSQSRNNNYRGSLTYARPIAKKTYLDLNYSLGHVDAYSFRRTLEKTPGSDKYEVEVPFLTNEFDFSSWTNEAGLAFRFSKPKKYHFSIGGSAAFTSFTQKDLRRDTTIRYNFVNLFPQANLNLTMKRNRNLNFSYRGSTEQPGINQLQPVADNTDPFNIQIGNPDLKLALRHNMSLWFNRYDMLTESGYFMNVSFDAIQNGFSTRNFVDSLGRRVSQAVNVNGNFNGRFYFNYNGRIKKTNYRYSLGPEVTYGQFVNIVNTERNVNQNASLGFQSRLDYSKEKKYEFGLSYNPSYNYSRSSINTDIRTNYWLQAIGLNYKFFLGKKWELGGEINANFRQRTEVFIANNNAVLWNSWLDRKLGKDNTFKFRLYAFDVLNQNIGFQRTINSNFINERTYNTFNRYLMISFIWNFSRNGKPMNF